MRVYCYFNLTRKVWSIAEVKGNGRGKLIAHMPQLALRDAVCVVSEATRQSVIRKGAREVHAGIIGELVDHVDAPSHAVEVTYNPHRCGTFTDRAGNALSTFANVTFGASRYPQAW